MNENLTRNFVFSQFIEALMSKNPVFLIFVENFYFNQLNI